MHNERGRRSSSRHQLCTSLFDRDLHPSVPSSPATTVRPAFSPPPRKPTPFITLDMKRMMSWRSLTGLVIHWRGTPQVINSPRGFLHACGGLVTTPTQISNEVHRTHPVEVRSRTQAPTSGFFGFSLNTRILKMGEKNVWREWISGLDGAGTETRHCGQTPCHGCIGNFTGLRNGICAVTIYLNGL